MKLLSDIQFYALLALKDGPKHGYKVMKFISNFYPIGQTSAYNSLKSLCKWGMVESTEIKFPKARTLEYNITPEGEVSILERVERLKKMIEVEKDLNNGI